MKPGTLVNCENPHWEGIWVIVSYGKVDLIGRRWPREYNWVIPLDPNRRVTSEGLGFEDSILKEI